MMLVWSGRGWCIVSCAEVSRLASVGRVVRAMRPHLGRLWSGIGCSDSVGMDGFYQHEEGEAGHDLDVLRTGRTSAHGGAVVETRQTGVGRIARRV